MADSELETKLARLQKQAGQLEPEPRDANRYKPNKRQRLVRRRVYERFYWLRDDSLRTEAEQDWELADKEYNMFRESVDDDWRANLHLPDAFAAIQAQMQETIERKSRPNLIPTEESDEPITEFSNAVLTYNMNNTDYDYQYFLAKLAAAIRGTAFLMNYWRRDKRVVKDPTSVNDDGEIKYTDKEITDFDDDYTEWVPNEFIYIDEKAKHINEANDMFKREIINIEEFHRIYENKSGFFDTEFVVQGGDTSNRSYYKLPKDTTEQDVEVLHYYNRSIDAYWVVANNVTIYDGPLPSKHKELPLAVMYQYRVPGRFWGLGIPKVIHYLSEERKTIRNLNMDRQKLQINKMFMHNTSFDIDDEDLVSRPHGLISVDTGGQPIQNALVPVEYGDVPASYFRTEEILLEDIRRAHGIDDRIQGVNMGGTATEAAILKETSLKRVNLIMVSAEMDTVIRIGRLKWSNIQWLYGTPRLEKITQNNKEREKKIFRTISVQGKKFAIVDDDGKKSLRMEDVKGNSALTLKPEYAKYLQGSFDVSVDADIFTPISKAIEQTKKTEMFGLLLSNPATMAVMDINTATADVLAVNNIKPEKWLKNVENKKDMMMLAESENMVIAAGQPLSGTQNASEDHTIVHLMYTQTEEFKYLPQEIKQLIMAHIMEEHDNNPATGAAADLMAQHGLMPKPEVAAGMPGMETPLGGPGLPPPNPSAELGIPQAQVADLEPTNFASPE